MAAKKSHENFMKELVSVRGDRYDYSKVVYTGSGNKIAIICRIHGLFYQTANKHLRGSHCPQCARERIKESVEKNTDIFISKSKLINGLLFALLMKKIMME